MYAPTVRSKEIKIAIYTRVSTNEQAEEGYSIEEQERLLRECSNSLGGVVYKVYSDRGISGKNISARPAMKEMLRDAEEGKFNMVLTWKINRIARNTLNLLQVVEMLEKRNISFRSYSENFETETPMGKFSIAMLGAVGELERGTIAQNVKMGMMARAREGRWCGNKVFGYDLVPVEDSEYRKRKETMLVVNSREANIIKEMFQMYAEGNGYRAITNKFNKLGYKTKKGNDFSIGGIKEILTNPVYIGKIRYNLRQNWSEKRRRGINSNPLVVDGVHEAIIDMETWDKVQAILKEKTGKPSRIYDGEFPLTGILKCPVCGSGMVISRVFKKRADGSKNVLSYYACGAWKNKGTAVCKSNMVRTEKVNEYVFNKLSELLSNEKMVKEIVKNLNKERKNNVEPSKKQLEKVEKELQKLESKKSRIFEAYEENLVTKDEFVKRKDEINEKVSDLLDEKQKYLEAVVDDTKQEVSYELVRSVLENFHLIIEKCSSREEKKRLLHMIISEITINEKREVDSIKLKINDSLIEYISKQDGVSIMGTPSIFVLKNMGVQVLNMTIVI